MPVLKPEALIEILEARLRSARENTGITKLEVDLSGGIDSAVVLALGARVFGADNMIAVHSQINSNPVALQRAQLSADSCGVKLCVIDLTETYNSLITEIMTSMAIAGYDTTAAHQRIQDDKTILGSIRSTLRAPVGRGYNRIFGGGLRLGTGNECEDRWLRFFQKGGDGEVDSNVLAVLSKGEVYQLARALGVPTEILTAVPSPDLWGEADGHNDEDEISSYLGVDAKEAGQTWYSYVDMDTGVYSRVGLIERVSRYLDTAYPAVTMMVPPSIESVLFDDHAQVYGSGPVPSVEGVINHAYTHSLFEGLSKDLICEVLFAARQTERITRHKMNPNCPTSGDRASLVTAGILTNNI